MPYTGKQYSILTLNSPLSTLNFALHQLDEVGIGYGKTVKSEVNAMSLWNEARTPALKTEEAALLTAMSRPMARGAALKTVLRAARQMEGMQVREIQAEKGTGENGALSGRNASPARVRRYRAALSQVWNRP